MCCVVASEPAADPAGPTEGVREPGHGAVPAAQYPADRGTGLGHGVHLGHPPAPRATLQDHPACTGPTAYYTAS